MLESIVKVTLPELGESVTEGTVVEWRVAPGQWVEEGATLVDVTTDKVDVEVPAPVSGVVTAVHVAAGEPIAVGGTLAEIDPSAEKPATQPASEPPAPAPPPKAQQPATPAKPAVGSNGASAPANAGGPASHQARRLAERHQVDLSRIRGSGPGGLIVREDVRRASEARGGNGATAPRQRTALVPLPADAKVTPLRGPALALVGYMEQSLEIPTATSFRTLSVGPLEQRRSELNAALRQGGRSEKVSFTHLIAFAIVRAAHDFPAIVATFRRDGGVAERAEAGIHLGIAVDAQRKDGTPSLGRARLARRGRSRFRRVPRALRRSRRKRARQQAHRGRTDRRDVHADESGRNRHGRFGSAAHGGPGGDHRGGSDRLPARTSRTRTSGRCARSASPR